MWVISWNSGKSKSRMEGENLFLSIYKVSESFMGNISFSLLIRSLWSKYYYHHLPFHRGRSRSPRQYSVWLGSTPSLPGFKSWGFRFIPHCVSGGKKMVDCCNAWQVCGVSEVCPRPWRMCSIWGDTRSGAKWNSGGNFSSRNDLIWILKVGTNLMCFRNSEGTDYSVFLHFFNSNNLEVWVEFSLLILYKAWGRIYLLKISF